MSKSKDKSFDDFMPQGVHAPLHGGANVFGAAEKMDGKAGEEFKKKLVARLGQLNSNMNPSGFTRNANQLGVPTPAASSEAGFEREANSESTFFGSSSADVVRTPMLYVDPLWDTVLLLFPEDNIREVNKRLRHYYKFQPYVGNIIDIHSEFPLSDFECQVDDKEIKSYYNDVKERLNLPRMGIQMLRDRHMLGESIWYGTWDKTNYEWAEWNQYPPEYIDIKHTYVTKQKAYYYMPDPEIGKMIGSNDPVDKALLSTMNPRYLEHVKRSKPFLLDSSRVIHFGNFPSDYTLRGQSLIKRVLKDLLCEDQIRQLYYTFIQRHMNPIKIFKLGIREKGWIPSKKHFEKFRELLVQASSDPDFNLIYHCGLEVDYVGTKDKIENLVPHFEYIGKRIMVGLFCNEALLAGESAPYAGQTVNLKMLFHKYLSVRQELEREFKYKIFLPIAQQQELIRPTPAEASHRVKIRSKITPTERYFLPKFMWQKLNLLNNTTEQEFLLRLRDKFEIPLEAIADMFGYDVETWNKWSKNEEGTYADNDWRELKKAKLEDPETAKRYLRGEKLDQILKDQKKSEELAKEIEKTRPESAKPGSDMADVPLPEMPTGGTPTPSEGTTETPGEAPAENMPGESGGEESLPSPASAPEPGLP